eukprot:339427_1
MGTCCASSRKSRDATELEKLVDWQALQELTEEHWCTIMHHFIPKSREFFIYAYCHNSACQCGGFVVYSNHLNQKDGQKINKSNSLCCANPNGNSLNVNVLDYVCNSKKQRIKTKNENTVCKMADDGMEKFKSKRVQKNYVIGINIIDKTNITHHI